MFGGSAKSGRGGDRGGARLGKRNLHYNFPTSSISRQLVGHSSAPCNNSNTSSTSAGGATTTSACVVAKDTFSLVTANPKGFPMIIRLAPDMVDEIKRCESGGASARIKFDSDGNNSSENVIDVGGKEFRFTWSREMGDLCDIYEERQSGEDGNGLLVESGCAWRKLNVQRVLDESTKNHVKMRSEEAERKAKSRKAIILDHRNPSVKNQMKALAAAEANPSKMLFKQKKEPPNNKQKAETPPGPPKSAQKHGFSLSTPLKGRTSVSPLPSTPEKPHASASPFGPGSLSKGHASVEDNMPTQTTNKDKALSSEKTRNQVYTTAVLDKAGRKGAKPTDLRSTLISLLMDSPNGMSLKALKESVGENFPNSGRQIEPIIKKIAFYRAPRGYFLKSGTELESLKKPLFESGSSENNQQEAPDPGDNLVDVRDSEQSVSMKTHITENDEQTQLYFEPGEVIAVEKINIPCHSPDTCEEKKVSENSDGLVASSSGSESDSESNTSYNSKEGTDEEVDIMTCDDDKEPKDKLQAPEPESSTSPLKPDGLLVRDSINAKVYFNVSEVVENMKNLSGYTQVTETVAFADSLSNKEGEMHPRPTKPSADCSLHSEGKHFDNNAECSKEVKAGATEAPMSEDSNLLLSQSPRKSSSRRPSEDSYRARNTRITDKTAKDITNLGLHRAYNQPHPSGFILDSLQCNPTPFNLGARTKAPFANDGPSKYAENPSFSFKSTERSCQMPEAFPMQKDKIHQEIHDEDGYNNERRPPRNPREGVVDKNSTPADSDYKKRCEFTGTFEEVGSVSNSNMGYPRKGNNISDMDRSPVISGRGPILRMELSDLELGQLCDALPEETTGVENQFDKKGSFKQSENKLSSSDHWNPDLSKGKPAAETIMDSVKPFSTHLNVGVHSNPYGSSKKKSPDHYGQDATKSHYKVVERRTSQLPRVEQAEVGFQTNKLADVNTKSGQIEAVASQWNGLEGYGDTNRKVPVVTSQLHDTVEERVAQSTKGSKRRKIITSSEVNDKCKEPPLIDIHDSGKKRKRSFSDESCFIYSMYEKDKPELKGPIKDHSQYMEYVREFREKYDSYTSINEILDSDRNDFIKHWRGLESAKRKDMNKYYSILEQLKERATRHKRLKKVFVVLYEELKCIKETMTEYANSYQCCHGMASWREERGMVSSSPCKSGYDVAHCCRCLRDVA